MRSTLVKATALVACGAIVTAACSSDPAAPPAAPVASVTMSVTVDTIRIAGFTVLVATPLDASGNPLTGRTIAWLSSDPTVASVAPNGTVTGVGPGDATITATVEGQNAAATVSVWRGLTGSWDGTFDISGPTGVCDVTMSLTEDGMAAVTGTGTVSSGSCSSFNMNITGTNNTGGVPDSVELSWDVGPGSFISPFNGTFDGDASMSALVQGGGCVDCPVAMTRSSIAPATSSPARVGGTTARSFKR